ncbi:MAG: helix-turn-helix transcriptional regulator [Rhizobiaceae bacterium]
MSTCEILRIEAIDVGRSSIQHMLIDSIGTESFEEQLSSLLMEAVGAEECRMYKVLDDCVELVRSRDGVEATGLAASLGTMEDHWIDHPSVAEALAGGMTRRPLLIRIDPSRIDDLRLHDRLSRRARIMDLVMVWGDCGGERYGLTVTRSVKSGAFQEKDIAGIATLARSLISLIAKHAQIIDRMRTPFLGLKSLGHIEEILSMADVKLPRRELEVCSHILYGISIAGIASTLGIAEESVVTYRKRAYQRLGIGSRHELLLWYLSLASVRRLEVRPQPARRPAISAGQFA